MESTNATKTRYICKIYYIPSMVTKTEKDIFSVKVKVKVTRSLTLMSFGRASLVEYACQTWSIYLLRFKSIANVKVVNRQTDRTKTICPKIRSGGIKMQNVITAWLCLGFFFWRYALLSVSCKAKLPCPSRKLDPSHTAFLWNAKLTYIQIFVPRYK